MPALDKFDAPHTLTIRSSSDMYGCWNRNAYQDQFLMKNSVWVRNPASKECKHDMLDDPRCAGCRWQGGEDGTINRGGAVMKDIKWVLTEPAAAQMAAEKWLQRSGDELRAEVEKLRKQAVQLQGSGYWLAPIEPTMEMCQVSDQPMAAKYLYRAMRDAAIAAKGE